MEFNQIKKLIKDSDEFIYNDTFFELLKETSLLEFRKNILMCQQIKPSCYLESKVLRYYNELLQEFNGNSSLFHVYEVILEGFKRREFDFLDNYKDFNYFIDKKMIIQLQDYSHYSERLELATDYLKNATNQKISEIVVDGLFGDTIYNVWINIKEMLRYHSGLDDNNKVLSEDKIQFYKMILKIDKMDCKDKIELYYQLKDKNVGFMFYKDLRTIKDISYQMINNRLINVDTLPLNNEDSDKYEVPIYDLVGDDFFMLIRCIKEISSNSSYIRNCYSLISSYNMEVFNKRVFIYGYKSFPSNRVLHMFENDSHSSRSINSLDYIYDGVVNRVMFANQIVTLDGWSEIQIKNQKNKDDNSYQVLRPDFLVVFDNLEPEHIVEANRLGIPIVKIHKDMYFNKIREEHNKIFEPNICHYEKIYDNYTDGSYMEEKRKVRRNIK